MQMVEIARPIWSAIAIRHNHGKLNNKKIVEIQNLIPTLPTQSRNFIVVVQRVLAKTDD
jgi:hypothetical protein